MTMFKVEELEAGPLLDQAVLLAMGAMRVLEPPANAPANVRERWPDGGCLVLVDGGNMAFYGAPPPFSTDWAARVERRHADGDAGAAAALTSTRNARSLRPIAARCSDPGPGQWAGEVR